MTESEIKSLKVFNAPRIKSGSEVGPLDEPLPPAQPGFPILTVIGTIVLIILAAATLIRNHHPEADSAPVGTLQNGASQVIAEDASARPPVAATPPETSRPTY